jgi:predicted RNA-binding protein with PIN domain
MKITEKDFNAITGETTFTERDETAQEQAEREAFEAKAAAAKVEAEAKAAQRQTILDRLGLTEEEARILLGGN